MCQLWGDFHPLMAKRRNRPLSLQRMRPLSQDEWNESAIGQTNTAPGKRWPRPGHTRKKYSTTKKNTQGYLISDDLANYQPFIDLHLIYKKIMCFWPICDIVRYYMPLEKFNKICKTVA